MFGRIRASPSSLETLEGSPSKMLKDDSFSIYETTLMKLKQGAQRDISASSSTEMDEIINDSSIISAICSSENCSSASVATPSSSQQILTSPSDGIMVTDMDTDSSSITTTSPPSRDHVSDDNSDQPRHNNVSILHFFKFKDPCVSSCGEPSSTTKNDSSGSISSTSIEFHSTSEMESIQSFEDFELSN